MTGIQDLSDEDLQALYAKSAPAAAPAPAPAPLGSLSDDDLVKHWQASKQSQPPQDPHPWLTSFAKGVTGLIKSPAPREFAKGVPVMGGLIPQTPEMTQYEQEHPWKSGALNMAGGMAAMAPLAMAAPEVFGARMGLRGLLQGSAAMGGIGAADEATREVAAPLTGQQTDPSAMLRALSLPSTGYGPADAALTAAGTNAVAAPLFHGIANHFAPAVKPTVQQQLQPRGVQLSPGQMTGGSLQTAENLGKNLPFSGFSDIHAQGLPSFNRGAENMVLEPARGVDFGGQVSPEIPADIRPGFEGRAEATRQKGIMYHVALEGAPGERTPVFSFDEHGVNRALADVVANHPGVSQQTVQNYVNIMQHHVIDKIQYPAGTTPSPVVNRMGTMQGDNLSQSFKAIDRARSLATGRKGDGNDLASMLSEGRDFLRGNVMEPQDPLTAQRLQAANAAHAADMELTRAGSSPSITDPQGLMGPEHLLKGSAGADISLHKGASSRGTTVYGDYARAGIDAGIHAPIRNPVAQMEGLGIAGAAAAFNPWLLGAYPAGWAYASGPGQTVSRAFLNYGAPAVRGLAGPTAAMMGMPSQAQALQQALGQGGQ